MGWAVDGPVGAEVTVYYLATGVAVYYLATGGDVYYLATGVGVNSG